MKTVTTFFLLAFSFSCSKNDEMSTLETKTSLLTNKKWNLVSVSGKRADGSSISMNPASAEPYDLDNYYYYQGDETYTFNDGAIKTPGIIKKFLDEGTWTFKEADKYVYMLSNSPGADWYCKIIELTASNFRYELLMGDDTYRYHFHTIE